MKTRVLPLKMCRIMAVITVSLKLGKTNMTFEIRQVLQKPTGRI